MTVTVEIGEDLERRVEALARKTGQSRDDVLRDALANGLDDVEDYWSAAATLRRIERGEEQTTPLLQVMKDLGLED